MDDGAGSYRRFLKGDDSGFTEIVKQYRDGLLFFINGYVGNLHIAEELTEDVFFTLAVRKPRYRDGGAFKTWLFTIARNKALNYRKRQSRHRTVPLEEAEADSGETDAFEKAVLQKEQSRQLRRAMEKLTPDYREVLHLIYFENMSNDSAARVLKKNKRQIENLSYRARKALRRILEQEDFDYEEL